jgi:hypothetical protein
MPEIGTSGLMSGDGKRVACYNRARPRLYRLIPLPMRASVIGGGLRLIPPRSVSKLHAMGQYGTCGGTGSSASVNFPAQASDNPMHLFWHGFCYIRP